jgi:hypothetical protein
MCAPAGCVYGQWVVYVVEAVGVGGWAGNLHFGYGVPLERAQDPGKLNQVLWLCPVMPLCMENNKLCQYKR